MILDNRQAIPDIVISRQRVPNIHIDGYSDANHLSHGRFNNASRDIKSCNPQKAKEPPKHLFSSGNNNGSPRHVPKNGNIYVEDAEAYHYGVNKFLQCNSRPEQVSQRSSCVRGRTEGKSNIPLLSSNISTGNKSCNGQVYKPKTVVSKKNTGSGSNFRPLGNYANRNHLPVVHGNNFDNRQDSIENRNSKIPSSKQQSHQRNIFKYPSTQLDANMIISTLTDSLEIKPAIRGKQKYKENNVGCQKRTDNSGKLLSDNSDLNIKHSFTLTNDKIGNLPNSYVETKSDSSGNEWFLNNDSLINNSATPAYQNFDLNWQSIEWNRVNQNSSSYMDTDKSEEENDKIMAPNPSREYSAKTFGSKYSKGSSMENIKDISFDSEEIKLLTEDECSSPESSSSFECKMAVVNCNGKNYLTKLLVNDTDIHGLKIVGRIGLGGNGTGRGMSLENPDISSQMQYTELRKDVNTENASSLLSQGTDSEFEHEAADYQWLLDYEYRENYSRDSLTTGNDGSLRISILQTGENAGNFSYEAISRNLDANLAEIDMDDFRSEDIHQILSLPKAENEFEEEDNVRHEEEYEDRPSLSRSHHSPYHLEKSPQQENLTEIHINDRKHGSCLECNEYEECCCISGDTSLYKPGPLFSPFREPIPPSFSVDSLDSGSIHEDLILTCQANKDNYTIAFEGSFVNNSSNSDYRDTGTSESGESATWSTENLEEHMPASDMTHSDQPYTTWSRVSRRLSQTPESDANISAVRHENTPVPKLKSSREQYLTLRSNQHSNDSKSCSMPNLMRRSLMRKSLETAGQCMKVYDLQKSLRSSHLSQSKVDANNFSLLQLFMRQKSLGKDTITRSSSFTDPSNDGCYSSSEHHSTNNESSDWPMNSQSETDLERSSSPLQNISRNKKLINPNNTGKQEEKFSSESISTDTVKRTDRIESLNNNNNNMAHHIDNVTLHLNSIENLNNFDDSLRDVITCSKPPMTSPIREEPEGMEMSLNQEVCSTTNKSDIPIVWTGFEKSNNGVINGTNIIRNNTDLAHYNKEDKINECVYERSNEQVKESYKQEISKQILKNCRNESDRRLTVNNKSLSNKMMAEQKRAGNIREKPKPRPRITKEATEQCVHPSNLRSATTLNTSKILDQKEVYVYYPNYALPDLNFLREKRYSVDTKIFLVPQHYNVVDTHKNNKGCKPTRPLSHNEITKIKRENFSHVEDWESLNFLLPKELKEILRDSSDCMETMRPSFCHPIKASRRPLSCDFTAQRTFNDSKGSSNSVNSTHPSSGYRGSSTMLNDSDSEDHMLGGNSKCQSFTKKVRPASGEVLSYNTNTTDIQPLPKGVLRKCTSIKGSKRTSCDMDNKSRMREELLKRRSLPEFDESKEAIISSKNPGTIIKDKLKDSKPLQCSCLHNCTGFCSAGLKSKNIIDPVNLPKPRTSATASAADITYLKTRVSNQISSKNNKSSLHKNGGIQRPSELLPKKTMGSKNSEEYNCVKVRDKMSAMFTHRGDEDLPPMLYDLGEKKTLVISVRSAVEKLVSYYQLGNPREKMQPANKLSSSEVTNLVLNKLCPAVYALLSDGLLPSLHSLFGKIINSVWKVVETTSQLGPSTKALHDLVMTLNGEECLTEGPIKFNAFIFGLLNLRSLDAWLSYLRTREVALQKHYHPESFLYLANTAMRSLFDDFLLALRPLALLPFHLDILFEYKTLHASLIKMEERLLNASRREANPEVEKGSLFDHLVVAKESKEFRNVATQQDRIRAFMHAIGPQQVEIRRDRSNSPRPRSCYEKENNQDVEQNLKKRWSGVGLGSKLVTALDRLMNEGGDFSEEDYAALVDNQGFRNSQNFMGDLKVSNTSSRYDNVSEYSATDKDTENEKCLNHQIPPKSSKKGELETDRFRRLQLKWEQMTIHPLRNNNSQVDSSNRNTSGSDKCISPGCTSRSRIPRPVSITSPQRPCKPFETAVVHKEKPKPIPRRSLKDKISSTDAPGRNVPKTLFKSKKSPSADTNRASSVPGRGIGNAAPVARLDFYRRNAASRSSSQGREGIAEFRYVQTLHHRLATDNGHLSFNKGDLLSVVVDVDEKYILCCLNDRKGIVPRSSVIPFTP